MHPIKPASKAGFIFCENLTMSWARTSYQADLILAWLGFILFLGKFYD